MASWSPTISPDAVSENWSTVLLSLRDLRRDVPINYNQYPGIALTPACFADARYTDDKAACVANLIAIGYRSFLLDLYLDGGSGAWGICPAASDAPAPTTTAAAATSLLPRQQQQQPPPATYTCAPTFNATALLTIFDTWMTGTNTDLGARILLLTLSLHPAAPNTTTFAAAPQPLANTLRSANILADAYTPTQLLADRRDLNSSWYDDAATTNATYFTSAAAADDGDTVSTPDGWPSEAYLEFKLRKRVLIAYGAIDPALPYDAAATGDDATIFPAGYLGQPIHYNASSSAGAPPPCLYSAANTSIAAGNSSWAQVLHSGGAANITALVNCGYSTLLDPPPTAANTSLDARFGAYKAHIAATAAWAWAPSQPQNTTGREPSFRCAAMSAHDGTWSVADCTERKRAACRLDGQPYAWTLTPTLHTYYNTTPCTFAAPRTPLENAHLLAALRAATAADAWIDLNSLGVEACWVSGGANATCPYGAGGGVVRRQVIVSAVAALIVLVVFGLMWFAKGASWRVERSRRRRRRAAKKRVREGVEYEGVPS